MNLVKDYSLQIPIKAASRVSDHDVQVIYGPQVEKIANDVKSALGLA